jgi:hypothetical protein
MKKPLLLMLLLFATKILSAQDASVTHAEFNFQGKTYIADYDNAKHVLKMNEEVSFEVYDETGSCIKRSEGLTVDFKSILKPGVEKTFTVRFFKKSKKKKSTSNKNTSIKQKGEIGVMVITDQK